jgi:hypothetical protein
VKRIALILLGLSSLTWSEFSSNGGVVKDSTTKLEWQNKYNGKIKELDWDSAKAYCESLKLKGDGWRLPSKGELSSLIDRETIHTEKSGDAINSVFSNQDITRFDYWTSTIAKDEPNLRWGVNFRRGYAGRYTTHYGLKVRCVRGELIDNVPMAKLYGSVGKESKPFSEEISGPIVILGEANPTMVKPQLHSKK